MENSKYLATDPLAALKLKPMALQGGGGTFNNSDPMTDMAMQMGMKAAGTMMGVPGLYSGTTEVQGYNEGTESVPGQRTGQDTVPAMLSPGEAVIPASAAQDPANQGAIQGMVEQGQEQQGMAAQLLQSLGLPLDPQLIAMIEDMLAQGVPPEQIVQQLQERMQGTQGGQEVAQPQEGMGMPQEMAQGAPMQPMEEGMGMPQGLYEGSINVQGTPLSGKGKREQHKFQADESRKDAAFQADQRRKDDAHSESMKQKSESAMYARSMSGE